MNKRVDLDVYRADIPPHLREEITSLREENAQLDAIVRGVRSRLTLEVATATSFLVGSLAFLEQGGLLTLATGLTTAGFLGGICGLIKLSQKKRGDR